MSIDTIATELLRGEQAETYNLRLMAAIRAGRLNNFYPDPRALISHLEPMSPSISGSLYDGIQVNIKSGLPSYREWTRVQTDVQIASEQLSQLGSRALLAKKARRSSDPIFKKQLEKFDYYMALEGRQTAVLGDMRVALRRIDTGSQRAWFHVVLDKLDVSGIFVRYAIDLVQQHSAWNQPVVQLDAEHARHTEAFQALIYQFTSLGSVFTWAKLTSMQQLQLERVSRCTVGPIFFKKEHAPQILHPLWEGGGEGVFCATFAQDLISGDISEARNNDPLSGILAEAVPAEARATFDQARARAGVMHYLDRKFVVPADKVELMQEICVQRGTRNIVYGV